MSNRFTKDNALKSARDFAATRMADCWYLFASDIRSAIIDQHIMNEIRAADRAESEHTYTATQIIEFRDEVISYLEDGVVPAGTRALKRGFKIID